GYAGAQEKETQQAARAVTGVRFAGRRRVEQFFKPLVRLRRIGFVLHLYNYRLFQDFLLSKRQRTGRSRRAAARRSYRSSLRSSGSTRRMASADRLGSCDGIVAAGTPQAEGRSIKTTLCRRTRARPRY